MMTSTLRHRAVLLATLLPFLIGDGVTALQQPLPRQKHTSISSPANLPTRRSFLASGIAFTATATPSLATELTFLTTPSGLQYADAKLGSGPPLTPGQPCSIDYSLSTTGARYGTKIYSTQDKGAPYRWILGDGSTIPGVEEAILGGEGVEPMRPGGIRRVIIPSALGYRDLATAKDKCEEGKGVGPIPPKGMEDLGPYQRFKNIYCNPERMYQPDIVMDIKLYGKRS